MTVVTEPTYSTVSLNRKINCAGLQNRPSRCRANRIDGINALVWPVPLLVNVSVDDGPIDAPAGTDFTATFAEDTTYTIRTSNFGFTDPNDFPANTFAAVRIASLPTRGSLTLNNVPVTLGQTIPVANLNLNQLRTGQQRMVRVRTMHRSRSSTGQRRVIEPRPDTESVSRSMCSIPTMRLRSHAPILRRLHHEDSTNSTGILVSQIANVIRDVDPGACLASPSSMHLQRPSEHGNML